MVNEKERIIKKLGISCEIKYADGTTKTSKCLVKRASALFNSIEALESHRRGDFIYSDNVTGGCIITNNISGEQFIAVGTYPEVFKDITLATVSHMLVLNAKLSLKRTVKKGTVSGEVKSTDIVVLNDIPVFIEGNKDKLRQFEMGLYPDADYAVFMPSADIDLLDKISVSVGGKVLNLKVIHVDFISYPNVTVLHLATETRK